MEGINMKCPRCGLIVTDLVPKCQGCGFSIQDLDRKLKRHPKRIGFVNDFAGVLSAEEKSWIENQLSEFNQKYGGQFVLVIVKSTKPIKPSEYVFWLFNRWQIGGENHTGLMVLLALSERRIESEVGYSWEDIISDVESGKVFDETVIPLLKEDKIHEALRKGIEQISGILEEAAIRLEEHTEEESASKGSDV
jgi:uncharacterized protein